MYNKVENRILEQIDMGKAEELQETKKQLLYKEFEANIDMAKCDSVDKREQSEEKTLELDLVVEKIVNE